MQSVLDLIRMTFICRTKKVSGHLSIIDREGQVPNKPNNTLAHQGARSGPDPPNLSKYTTTGNTKEGGDLPKLGNKNISGRRETELVVCAN